MFDNDLNESDFPELDASHMADMDAQAYGEGI